MCHQMHFLDLQQLDHWLNGCMVLPSLLYPSIWAVQIIFSHSIWFWHAHEFQGGRFCDTTFFEFKVMLFGLTNGPSLFKTLGDSLDSTYKLPYNCYSATG